MTLRRSLCSLAMLVAISLAPDRAEPCAVMSGPVIANTAQPDFPLDTFANGHLGLVSGDYAFSYLVVAYRHLSGIGLDADERAGALEVWHRRIGAYDPSASSSPPPADNPVDTWRSARASVMGDRGPDITTTMERDYADVDNCLADSFRVAARTLAARAAQWGAQSPTVRAWVASQDAVFRNCGGAFVEPPALAANVPDAARRDHDYQLAAAHFYAGQLDVAEHAFRAIASDRASPWAATARYAIARVLVRRAVLRERVDDVGLAEAEQHLRAILADASMHDWHAASTSYLAYVRALRAPASRFHELALALGHDRLGTRFGETFFDAAVLFDRGANTLASPATGDDLESWVHVVRSQGPADFEFALRTHDSTHSPAWLVAALISAPDTAASDPRLSPLLHEAETLRPDSPAYVTANFHRARLLLARTGVNRASLAASLSHVIDALPADDGPSARNHLRIMLSRVAPDTATFFASATVVPAAFTSGDGPNFPVPVSPNCTNGCPNDPLFQEYARSVLSRLPLTMLIGALTNRTIPPALRAVIASHAYVRALLLHDRRAGDVGRVLAGARTDLGPFIAEVARAANDTGRRFAIVWFLLHVPSANWQFHEDEAMPDGAGALDESDAYWCAASVHAPAAEDAPFLTAAQRRRQDTEMHALEALGGGATYLAREAVAAATSMPDDPRVPEMLHLAVRATRFGCRDADTLAASRAAFVLLHRRFPHNAWTQQTRYFYGAE